MRTGTKPNNLESRRPMFLQLGLLISLGLALTAFEWTTFGTEQKVKYVPMEEALPIIPEHIVEYHPNTRSRPKSVIPPVIEKIKNR